MYVPFLALGNPNWGQGSIYGGGEEGAGLASPRGATPQQQTTTSLTYSNNSLHRGDDYPELHTGL